MSAQLLINDLVFGWPGRPLFAGWSSHVEAGVTWVQGPNGCGKSTLLKLLAGALPMAHGSACLRLPGQPEMQAADDPLAWRQQVVWSGPDGPPFTHLTAAEQGGLLQQLYPAFDTKAWHAAVDALGLWPALGQTVAEMSSGTRRKVGLAGALAIAAPVLLLDEPLAALDAASMAYVRQVLETEQAAARRILVVVSHEPVPASRVQIIRAAGD
jgi:ABC-type multidrug transport system ATPase subunit